MDFVKYRLTIILLLIAVFSNFYFIYDFEKIRDKILANQPNLPQPRPPQNLQFEYQPIIELTAQEKLDFIESMKLDLNTAVIDELVKISGIGPGTAKRIIDYRKKNGYFNTVEDILNVPGIGETKFESFKEYITVIPVITEPSVEENIIEEEQPQETPVKKSVTPANESVAPQRRPQKVAAVKKSDKIDINSAGLDEITTIKGVGKSMAQRIIDYREENNGFRTIDDLTKVRGISANRVEQIRESLELKPYKKKVWRVSDMDEITPLNLNTVSYTELRQLPYITPTIASAIIEYRKNAGRFQSENDLRKIREIDYTTFTRIKRMFFAQ